MEHNYFSLVSWWELGKLHALTSTVPTCQKPKWHHMWHGNLYELHVDIEKKSLRKKRCSSSTVGQVNQSGLKGIFCRWIYSVEFFGLDDVYVKMWIPYRIACNFWGFHDLELLLLKEIILWVLLIIRIYIGPRHILLMQYVSCRLFMLGLHQAMFMFGYKWLLFRALLYRQLRVDCNIHTLHP